jgi:hypothetical protein
MKIQRTPFNPIIPFPAVGAGLKPAPTIYLSWNRLFVNEL